jgi:hypothetical protein
MGKSVIDMHDRIIKIVDAVNNSRHKDFIGRLACELADYAEYVNPLVILSIEVYKLDMPELLQEDIQAYSSSVSNIAERNYKPFICVKGKKGLHTVFIKTLLSALFKNTVNKFI